MIMSLGPWIVGSQRIFFPSTFQNKAEWRKGYQLGWVGGDGRGWGGPSPEREKGAALWPPAGVGRAVEVQALQ